MPRAFYTLCKGNVTVQIIVHVPRFEACSCAVELNHCELCNAIIGLCKGSEMVVQMIVMFQGCKLATEPSDIVQFNTKTVQKVDQEVRFTDRYCKVII